MDGLPLASRMQVNVGKTNMMWFSVRYPRGPTPIEYAYEIYKSHDLKVDL